MTKKWTHFPDETTFNIEGLNFTIDPIFQKDEDDPDWYEIVWIDDEGHREDLTFGDPWYVSSPNDVPTEEDIRKYIISNRLYEIYPELQRLKTKTEKMTKSSLKPKSGSMSD